MKSSPQNVSERLAFIAHELEAMALPVGRDGSMILDALEAMARVRTAKRAVAKAMLVKDSTALPRWRIVLPNGHRSPNPGPRWREGRILVSEYRRATSIKLIKRRSGALRKTLKEGKETTP